MADPHSCQPGRRHGVVSADFAWQNWRQALGYLPSPPKPPLRVVASLEPPDLDCLLRINHANASPDGVVTLQVHRYLTRMDHPDVPGWDRWFVPGVERRFFDCGPNGSMRVEHDGRFCTIDLFAELRYIGSMRANYPASKEETNR